MASRTSRFKGCLIGGLLGDCFGLQFEFEAKKATPTLLNNFFHKKEDKNIKVPILCYSDDTAMTNSIAKSLIKHNGFNAVDLAKRFVKEFFEDPKQSIRGYGYHVVDVFDALRCLEFNDVFIPARAQFRGSGSYGNGAAMRIAPVALFCYNKSEEYLIELAKQTALITHANRLGYNGAILQALAVQEALKCSPPLDNKKYLEKLWSVMEKVEEIKSDEIKETGQSFSYVDALKKISTLLDKGDVDAEKIEEELGNGVEAQFSVPTAIYVFLRAQKHIPLIETSNEIQRTVHYAISLGGDTDTIGCMAASIAGAFYGFEAIPHYLIRFCEASDTSLSLAESLSSIFDEI